MHPEGEVAASRAAGAAGTIYILSTISGHRMEDIRPASCGPVWYQLYLVGGRATAESAIERARAAGFSALVVTIDTAVAGMRERDLRNGMSELMSGNLLAKLPFLPQLFARPRWLARFLLDGGGPDFPNIVVPGQGAMPLIGRTCARFPGIWRGPIVIKGVLTAGDARQAIGEGADAIVVSNHGGRQLDGLPNTLKALPEVVAAVEGRAEVLSDGVISPRS